VVNPEQGGALSCLRAREPVHACDREPLELGPHVQVVLGQLVAQVLEPEFGDALVVLRSEGARLACLFEVDADALAVGRDEGRTPPSDDPERVARARRLRVRRHAEVRVVEDRGRLDVVVRQGVDVPSDDDRGHGHEGEGGDRPHLPGSAPEDRAQYREERRGRESGVGGHRDSGRVARAVLGLGRPWPVGLRLREPAGAEEEEAEADPDDDGPHDGDERSHHDVLAREAEAGHAVGAGATPRAASASSARARGSGASTARPCRTPRRARVRPARRRTGPPR
jgi:hypothetical protein